MLAASAAVVAEWSNDNDCTFLDGFLFSFSTFSLCLCTNIYPSFFPFLIVYMGGILFHVHLGFMIILHLGYQGLNLLLHTAMLSFSLQSFRSIRVHWLG